MNKYIDADKLIAEIERLHKAHSGEVGVNLEYLEDFITSLQQEQTEQSVKDVCACIEEYYGKALPFEDERTKASYHFFSAGRSFEFRRIEEEYQQHIIDLIDTYKRGMNSGYEKALMAMKAGKIEGSLVMTEFLSKLLGSGFGSNLPTMQERADEELGESYGCNAKKEE